MEILRSVDDGIAPHHRSPTSANKPAGRDLGAKPSSRITAVLLQSVRKASSFWIMLLLFRAAGKPKIGDFAAQILMVLHSRSLSPI
jgi:hypothetical protein